MAYETNKAKLDHRPRVSFIAYIKGGNPYIVLCKKVRVPATARLVTTTKRVNRNKVTTTKNTFFPAFDQLEIFVGREGKLWKGVMSYAEHNMIRKKATQDETYNELEFLDIIQERLQYPAHFVTVSYSFTTLDNNNLVLEIRGQKENGAPIQYNKPCVLHNCDSRLRRSSNIANGEVESESKVDEEDAATIDSSNNSSINNNSKSSVKSRKNTTSVSTKGMPANFNETDVNLDYISFEQLIVSLQTDKFMRYCRCGQLNKAKLVHRRKFLDISRYGSGNDGDGGYETLCTNTATIDNNNNNNSSNNKNSAQTTSNNAVVGNGWLVLQYTAFAGHTAVVKWLVEEVLTEIQCAVHEIRSPCDGYTVLHAAAKGGRLETMQYLLDYSHAVRDLLNNPSHTMETPLSLLVSGGHREILDQLVNNSSTHALFLQQQKGKRDTEKYSMFTLLPTCKDLEKREQQNLRKHQLLQQQQQELLEQLQQQEREEEEKLANLRAKQAEADIDINLVN